MAEKRFGSWPLIGGAAAAIGASLCCLGPLVLVTLGIGGAWIANLSALEPFRPYFLAIAGVFLFLAWKKIYRMPAAADCAPGSLCALPQTGRMYKVLFWVVVALVLIAAVYPYLAPLFY